MLECNNLSLGYDRTYILRDVSLSFPAGEVTALLGPNGCGKSTLLKGFCGLSKRFSGSLLVDGQPIESLSPAAVARRVAYLPQTRRVPDMTVEQLVLHNLL
jgi:iron complex transport system ATP-binding protein